MASRTSRGTFAPGSSGNPAGRRRPRVDHAEPSGIARAARADDWANVLSGFGNASYDKRQSGYFKLDADLVTPEEAREIWRGDPFGARIVETVPNEMLREGFVLSVADDAGDRAAEIDQEWSRLALTAALGEALCYERGYGGGAILIGANDGESDLTKPLVPERVVSVDWLTALESRDLVPVRWYTNPGAAKFGRPAIYRLNPLRQGVPVERDGFAMPTLVDIHESRLAIFPGIIVSRRYTTSLLSGWGDSVFTRVKAVLRDFHIGFAAAAVLVHDFSQAVYRVKGLAEVLTADNAGDFVARMRTMELSRSTARAVLIDESESFERKSTPISGLPELLDRFMTLLASAADMPLTLLMGQSPGGLNATGASDIRFFYDRIRSAQVRKVAPAIRQITRLIMIASGGEPEKWSIRFNPLWQPTTEEAAAARKTQADTDAIYLDRNVVDADEIAASRFSGAEFSFDTFVDLEARARHAAPPSSEVAVDLRGPPAAEPEPAKTAFTGVQVTALVDVVKAAGTREISRESAAAIIALAFPVSPEQAQSILGPESFEPTPPATKPFGGGRR